jgi:hypothetical protein
MPPRVRQGIQFIEQDEANGELRVTGDDDARMLLWAAQWLDEHREYIITAMRASSTRQSPATRPASPRPSSSA